VSVTGKAIFAFFGGAMQGALLAIAGLNITMPSWWALMIFFSIFMGPAIKGLEA
jgi:hypothetical protein